MEQLSLASPQPVSECEPHSRDYSWAEVFLLPWPGAAAVAWPREELLARAKELPPSTSAVIEHADGTVSIALLLPTGGEVTYWDETGRIDSMGKIVNGVMRITLHYAYDAAGRVRSRFATAKRPGEPGNF